MIEIGETIARPELIQALKTLQLPEIPVVVRSL
jgi:metal-sulfur cluster biosynthetic enzyme